MASRHRLQALVSSSASWGKGGRLVQIGFGWGALVNGLRTNTVAVTATGSWSIYKWVGSSSAARRSMRPTCHSSAHSAPPGARPWSAAGAPIRWGCSGRRWTLCSWRQVGMKARQPRRNAPVVLILAADLRLQGRHAAPIRGSPHGREVNANDGPTSIGDEIR